jgi:hypothetical protein
LTTEAEIGSAVYRHAVEFAKAQGRDEGELLDELIEESMRTRGTARVGCRDRSRRLGDDRDVPEHGSRDVAG